MAEYASVDGYHILLSHHPEYYPLVSDKVQLMLSGHAHGGQIRFFKRGLYAPGQGWLPKWTKGVYDNRLVVSAGLSNTASPIPRLFNPTEIVYAAFNEDSSKIHLGYSAENLSVIRKIAQKLLKAGRSTVISKNDGCSCLPTPFSNETALD